MMVNHRNRKDGFTLLELFLTLALAVVLMTLVNAAFRFYVATMDSSDAEMRRTMLASAIMQMIEDDLRGTIHPTPLDTSALEDLLKATAASAIGGSSGGGGGGQTGGAAEAAGTADPAAAEDESSTMTTETETSLVSGAAVLTTPGLIGNQYQIQIDTSRLPRLEEYSVMMLAEPGKLIDLPSDLKTVTYYVQEAGIVGVNDPLGQLDGSMPDGAGGLVRRVLDRNVSSYAVNNGNISVLNQTGELIAPEIVAMEFSYWDGAIWQLEWNSDELGELPLAVKINLTMIDPLVDVNDQEPRVFAHIVRLPQGKFIVEEEEDELAEVGI